jgi:hypothetical protein
MINAEMRPYDYLTIGLKDAYGQPTMPKITDEPVGSINIAIFNTSTSIQDNINYKDANYIGLTNNANVKDTFVIKYEGQLLKVLYINNKGRYTQVYLKAL